VKTLVIAALLALAPASTAAEHYCILFSNNGRKSKPAESHTFATFVEVADNKLTKQYTISWGPVGEWKLFDGKVPGNNRSLKSSIEEPLRKHWQVCMWGPYQIESNVFRKAEERYRELQKGELSYKAIDSRARKNDRSPGVNCIHAVSDIGCFVKTDGKYGADATGAIAKEWKEKKVCGIYTKDNDKILKPLELDKYPQIVRKY
jgi:hypothetical protein